MEKELLSKFIDEHLHPIFRVDLNGNLLYGNRASLDLMRSYGEEFNFFLKSLSEKEGKRVEASFGGRLYSFSVIAIRGENSFYLFGDDITEQRQADKMKDEFVGIVSHELRVPLSVVKGAISNLKDGIAGPLSGKQLELLDVANRNVNRLTRLIVDLLEMSRLESGKAHIHHDEVDLVSLIQEVVGNFQEGLKKNKLKLVKKIPPKVSTLLGDADLVHQVLSNILDNARRFAKKEIVIVVEEASPVEIMVKIENDGPPISAEEIQVIFGKFKQLHRPKRGTGYKGTGLGLAISREIIERLGGKIWAKSQSGKTSFYFTLPQFSEKGLLKRAVHQAIIRAEENQSPLALFELCVSNGDVMKKSMGSEKISALLSTVRDRISNQVLRKSDCLYPQQDGGEVVILTETDRIGSQSIRNRIERAVSESLNHEGKPRSLLQFELGMALYPEEAQEPEQLLKIALEKRTPLSL